MAQITMIELQALENVGLSLNTFNTNFKKAETGLNNIENFLNTTPAFGSLSIGAATVAVNTGSVDDVNLVVETAASIAGGLTVGKSISIADLAMLSGGATVYGNALFAKEEGVQPVTTMNHQFKVGSEFVLASTVTAIPDAGTAAITLVSESGINAVGASVVNVDVTNTTGTTNNKVFLGAGIAGQLLYVRFENTISNGNEVDFILDNFNSTYAEVKFTDSSANKDEIQKCGMTLFCDANNKWNILSILDYTNCTVTY